VASYGKHFGKQIAKEKKVRIHNTIAKTALKFDSEAGILEKKMNKDRKLQEMKLLKDIC